MRLSAQLAISPKHTVESENKSGKLEESHPRLWSEDKENRDK